MSCSGSEGWAPGAIGGACTREVCPVSMALGGKLSRWDRRQLVRQQFSPDCSDFPHEPGTGVGEWGEGTGGLEEKEK